MTSIYKYFVYIAFALFIIAIIKLDSFTIPTIYSTTALSSSFIFLFGGFIVNVLSFKQFLREYGYNVNYAVCLTASGFTIFTKYLPGKIWPIVSKATYISKGEGYPFSIISSIAVDAQIAGLWLGLALGNIGLIFLGELDLWAPLSFSVWLGLSIIVFSRVVHDLIEKLIKKVFKKSINIPKLALFSTLKVIPLVFAWWSLWSVGFYFMVKSLIDSQIPYGIGLAFPFAGTLSIMAVIAPGGIGVRESILTGYLILSGLSSDMSITISLVARLWFLIGEIFIFVSGLISYKLIYSHNIK